MDGKTRNEEKRRIGRGPLWFAVASLPARVTRVGSEKRIGSVRKATQEGLSEEASEKREEEETRRAIARRFFAASKQEAPRNAREEGNSEDGTNKRKRETERDEVDTEVLVERRQPYSRRQPLPVSQQGI